MRRSHLLSALALLLMSFGISCGGGGGNGDMLSSLSEEPASSQGIIEREFKPDAPSLQELKDALFEEFERLGIDPEKVAAKVSSDAGVFNLEVSVSDPDGPEGPQQDIVQLVWTERMTGDYDQNGLVSIADLTPLGQRFGESVAYDDAADHGGFAGFPSGDPDEDFGTPPGTPLPTSAGADNWRRSRIDGDANGEINISDITPIAVHFNEVVNGYRVYRKLEGESEFTLLPMIGDPEADLTIPRSTTHIEGGSSPDPNRPVRYAFDDVPAAGTYSYYVAPYEIATGEEGDPSNIIEVTTDEDVIINPPDNEPPDAALFGSPLSGRVSVTVDFDASTSNDSDGTIVSYKWDYDSNSVIDETTDTPLVSRLYDTPGQYTATVTVVDDDGAEDSASVEVNVIANIAPVAMITSDVNSGEPGLEVTLSASGSSDEDGTIVKYEWDFEGDGVYDFDSLETSQVLHIYETSGNYFPSVRVTDNEGATAEGFNMQEIVVNLGPTAVINADVTEGGDPLLVNFDALQSSDPDGELSFFEWDYNGDGVPNASGASSVKVYIYLDPGVYQASVRVTDDDGAVSDWSAPIEITVLDAPNAQLSADPLVGDPPLTVNFDASGSSDNGTIASFEWDFDGDDVYDQNTGLIPTTSFEYTERGVYYAKVRVTDDEGLQGFASVLIRVRLFPTADLIATPDNGDAPLQVTLDASGSTPGSSEIDRYEWDVDGNGTVDDTTTGPIKQHTYTLAGVYNPSVRVVDIDEGDDTASTTVSARGWRIVTIQSGAGSFNSLAIVNGNPAVSYHSQSTGLYYKRALDPLGMAWGSQIQLDDVPGFSGRHTKMQVVNGNPAIAYYEEDWSLDPENGIEKAKYIRAIDQDGLMWDEPVVVEDNLGDFSSSTALCIADGNPAMAWIKAGTIVRYARANDMSGATWGAPLTVADLGAGNNIWSLDLEVVNGNPAIAAGPTFYRSSNAQGSAWPAGVNASVNRFNRLLVIGGEPKIVAGIPIPESDRFTFRYSYGNNANGSAWTSTSPEGGSLQIGNYPGLGSYGGFPVYAFVGRETGQLQLRQANDLDGATWGEAETVLNGLNGLSGHIQILECQGLRAFTYYHETTGPGSGGSRLMFALYVE